MAKPKTKSDPLGDWGKFIREQGEKDLAIEHTLSPSRGQLENVVGLAKTILEQTILMKNSSDMAHQGIISFEVAQKIIDGTKTRIKETYGYLEAYCVLKDGK